MTKPTAQIYRMVMPSHLCPFGLKARSLLLHKGYAVEDHWLETREETDKFKAEHEVDTTPQVFIAGARIGGYAALREHFGMPKRDPDAKTYTPVLVVFLTAALLAAGALFASGSDLLSIRLIEWFVAITMTLLAMLKLRDIEAFSTMFLGYDLLARRYVPYAYIYPMAEFGAGLLMLSGLLLPLAIPVALFIGTVGAASVFKAVYLDKRDLKCACVGGNSNVPLGFVSLTENLIMVGLALWMLAKSFA